MNTAESIELDVAVIQNCALSFGARGLAAYILSLPPDSNVTVRTIAATSLEGREVIARYMRELEAAHLLVRTRRKGGNGQLVTTNTLFRKPQDPTALPPSMPAPRQPRPAQEGTTVYMIGQQGSSVVKIGITSDLSKRLRVLQVASPVPLTVLWHHAAGANLEAYLHKRFAPLRMTGEWFDFGDQDPVAALRPVMAKLPTALQ